MHVVIINGSPRTVKDSNTDKIIDSFGRGLLRAGAQYEKYAISQRDTWDEIRDAFVNHTQIIFALPLYVECLPGLLLEFLETLPQKDNDTQLSFIVQSGFAEGCQLRCCEEYLKTLPARFGCTYGGCLLKGDNFSIRIVSPENVEKITKPYEAMGEVFAQDWNFLPQKAKEFTGSEQFPLGKRIVLGLVFRTLARKMFQDVAKKWGCKTPLDARPYVECEKRV